MSLRNLSKIGQLVEHVTDKAQVAKLLEAATRFIEDARSETISKETRLDAAYKAIVQYSMVALYANGYRPPKSRPGHHQTMIQSLVHSIELDNDDRLLLDLLCSQHHKLVHEGGFTIQRDYQNHWFFNRPDALFTFTQGRVGYGAQGRHTKTLSGQRCFTAIR